MAPGAQVDWFSQNAPAAPAAPSATATDWFSQNAPKVAAPASPSGGSSPADITAPKVSDFIPDWQTPGKFAKGVGEGLYGMGKGVLQSVFHPINAIEGMGAGAEKIKTDLADRQYVAALADTLNLGGFDEQKAAQLWSQGKGAEAVGQAAPVAAANALAAESIPKTISALKTTALTAPDLIRSIATPAGRRALVDSASAVRDTVAARTQQMLKASADAAESHASRLVRNINDADEADLAAKGGVEKAGIDTSSLKKGLDTAQEVYRQVGQKMPGADLVAKRLNDLGGSKVTFEMAKQLRTDVGAAWEHATGAQRAILASTYGDLTDAMKNRAADLDLPDQFSAYNKIHSVIQDYQHKGLLGDLLDTKDSGKFYDEVSKRGNRAAVLKLQNTLADYGLQPDALDASYADVKGLHKFLQSHGAGSFIGIFRKLAEHPIGGGAGYLAGGLAGNYMTRIFGAWAGSALAERIAVLRALDKLGIAPETSSEIGAAAKVMPKPAGGATIGEQLASKGIKPPVVGGGGTVPEQVPIPEMSQAEKAEMEAQAGHPLSNEEAQQLRIRNTQGAAVKQMLGEPTPTTGRGTGPKYAYRVRDVGEEGVPFQSHSQATISQAEAEKYLQGRAEVQGKPQELVRIDLDRIPQGDIERVAGPNGHDWVRFKKPVPESAVGKVTKQTPAEQVEEAARSLGIKTPGEATARTMTDEEKETAKRQDRVKETVQIAKRLEKGERELERLERMKDQIGPERYDEATTEINRMLEILRDQIQE